MSTSPTPSVFRPGKETTFGAGLPVALLVLLLTFITASEAIKGQSFSTPTSNVVGNNPSSVVATDLNGDGKADLASANSATNDVSVLLNNGDGTFATSVNYAADLNTYTITAGDYNGDGKVDLAVTNVQGGSIGTGSISILLGNGNGTLQAAVHYNVTNAGDIVTADISGDGKLDLIVASPMINSLGVLLGNGNGTFQPVVTFAAGSQPVRVAIADFNGDTKPDLAATNYGASNISILLGNGNGTFQAPTSVSGGSFGIAASDLNTDGKQDLVSVGAGVLVNIGNGNGTFQAPVSYPSGDNPSPPVIADFNGDGKADVAVGNYFGGTVSVLRGNGDGTLQAAIPSPAKPNPTYLGASDLDSDGKLDLAIASNGTARVNVLLNSPSARGVAISATAIVPATGVLVATFKDYDTTKTAGNFTATINWGDTTTPTTGTIAANGGGGFNVTGTHTYAREGPYSVIVQIADTSGNFASVTSPATVADAPLTATGKTINAIRGLAFTAVVANFTDADPTGSVGEFSATIGWGDGTNSAGTITADGSGGFNVSGSHTYTNSGPLPVLVMIQAVGGSTATANSTANVSLPTIQFTLSNYTVNEGGGSAEITIVRIGDATGAASVGYATSDLGSPISCATVNGNASSRCDFTNALGSLQFGVGETSKTFKVFISQDNFVEGPETISLTLSSVTGDAVLGTAVTATLTIIDDATELATNPIDVTNNFVRQHYLDFLNREPDGPGFGFWTGEIENCTPKPQCTEIKRINVSAAFFLSIEFQQTGYLVYRIYKSAHGNVTGAPVPVRLNEFLPDTQEIGRGVVVGETGWELALENNKQAFASAFVSRTRFTNAYATTLTPTEFVNALFANAGVTPSVTDRDAAINEFGGASNTIDVTARGRALRRVAENSILTQQEFNKAFVLMQYFGYMRRNPNDAPESGLNFDGYDFWLNKLNQFNGNFLNADMVKAFIISGEYRQRFGP